MGVAERDSGMGIKPARDVCSSDALTQRWGKGKRVSGLYSLRGGGSGKYAQRLEVRQVGNEREWSNQRPLEGQLGDKNAWLRATVSDRPASWTGDDSQPGPQLGPDRKGLPGSSCPVKRTW